MIKKSLCLFFASALSLFVSAKAFSDHEFDIIGNVNNNQEQISRYDLYLIFTLKSTRWDDGTPIKVVIFNPDSDIHRQFITNHLGISTNFYNRLLRRARGDYNIVNSIEDLIQEIEQHEGSIGYTNDYLYVSDKGSIKAFSIRK